MQVGKTVCGRGSEVQESKDGGSLTRVRSRGPWIAPQISTDVGSDG